MRRASVERNTSETKTRLALALDRTGARAVDTQVPFFTHMLEAFARHGRYDLELYARGDVEVDANHVVTLVSRQEPERIPGQSSVPNRVTANWTTLSPGMLGSAGPNWIFETSPARPSPNTWFSAAVAKKLSGTDLTAGLTDSADIVANFNSSFGGIGDGRQRRTPVRFHVGRAA